MNIRHGQGRPYYPGQHRHIGYLLQTLILSRSGISSAEQYTPPGSAFSLPEVAPNGIHQGGEALFHWPYNACTKRLSDLDPRQPKKIFIVMNCIEIFIKSYTR